MPELVSILMPVFNAERTVTKAINSCLAQSYLNIEIIVLDNGSSDHSAEIIKSIPDSRIRLIESETNLGIAAGRNRLLKEAKGSFIAWLDADDEMLENRIEKQVAYFSDYPELDLLGTWIYVEQNQIKKAPLNHSAISAAMWFKNCMYQPSIMSRNFYKSENIFYDETYANSLEDYELWYRLKAKKKFANIDCPLTLYKLSNAEELKAKKTSGNFEENVDRLWSVKWKEISEPIGENDKKLFQHFLYNNEVLSAPEILSLLKTLQIIENQFKHDNYRLICAFHRLRIWRNAYAFGKLTNLSLLLNIFQYPSIQKLHLR
jgi:glycosyltransferase involved in cell wall biosynthesis